jgi:hypothetical protein
VAGDADRGGSRRRVEPADPLDRDAGPLERVHVAVVDDGERVAGAEVAAPDARSGSRVETRGRHDLPIGFEKPRL